MVNLLNALENGPFIECSGEMVHLLNGLGECSILPGRAARPVERSVVENYNESSLQD